MNKKRMQKEINKLVDQSFKSGKSDEVFISKVVSIIKKQPLSDSIRLLTLYLKGLKRKVTENTLVIESAIKLTEKELQDLKKSIKTEVYSVQQNINPSLLGGLRIKIGDEFLDFSLQSKINQVANQIRK